MSTSIDSWIKALDADVRTAKLVRKLYPDATITRDGMRRYFEADGAQPNRLAEVPSERGSYVVAFEYICDGDVRAEVQRPLQRDKPVGVTLERLREKHPEAYADLVRWVAGDIR